MVQSSVMLIAAVFLFLLGVMVGATKIFPYDYLKYGASLIAEEGIGAECTPHCNHQLSQFSVLSKHHAAIVMLGDSLTEDGRWNELLKRDDVINRGIGGGTSGGVIETLASLNPGLKTALIMIGVNDIGRGKDPGSIFNNYRRLIETLKAKNITPVIQSTLYVGKNKPSFYNRNVRQLNRLLSDYAHEHGITYIDLNRILAPEAHLKESYSSDGLHLNGRGYANWATAIQHTLPHR